MFSLARIFLVALAATSVFADYVTVLNDLKVLEQTTLDFISSINAYTGTSSQSLALQNKFSTLRKQVQQATADTNASPVPSAANAQTVLNYINNPLYVDTQRANTALKNKRQTFLNNGFRAVVLQNLRNIKNDTDVLADALIAKAPTAAIKTSGTQTKAKFDAGYNDAIAYFT